ncbi:39S ribosomal protein S18a, mitochondrial [Thrips palmi]|uniref:39S ribosomal protein S18a, mitochondrial n=1 Tax=Thrips palmi TaxID=161013 RepID=A0A6P9A0E6_THRPL|nr:39S ribosomal protein S18a, mitochondrial [Thrips palmi]
MIRALAVSLRGVAVVQKATVPIARNFSVSPWLGLKEIRETQDGNTLIIEGVNVKSPREDLVINTQNERGACSLCALGLDVKHTDILIIKQFLDHNAQLFPRNITGLCRWQHRKMKYLIEMATRAGLINQLLPQPVTVPAYQRGWRKFNSYYDESLIPESKSEYALRKNREFEEAYTLAKAEKDAHEEMLRARRAMRSTNGVKPVQLS